jgi:hypothetical protein
MTNLEDLQNVPPAKAGSGRKINGLSARLKSCPVTTLSEAEFSPARDGVAAPIV